MSIMNEFDDTIGHILLKGFLFVLDVAAFSLVVMFLWNFLAPILGLVILNYKAAVGVFLLSRFLLKDHLLTSEPTVVHCQHDMEEETEKEVAVNCLCGNSILNTDKFCTKCGLKQ